MARCVKLHSFLSAFVSGKPGFMGLKVARYLTNTPQLSTLQNRAVSTNPVSYNSSAEECKSSDKVVVHFVNQKGDRTTITATEGETLLDVVINMNLDISGFGACEGTLACSTCHLIFEEDIYAKMEPLVDEEIDMLDLAYGLTKTSRLGCQVCVQKWMDGMTVRVPQDVMDMRETMESRQNQ
ncbi:ferredoxin 1b [Lepisosteus oculatus]|uniref:ferredoxin 1b n=1 Tax=Lepisosteus oculatus TaxID=7918 RepID=UPI003714FA93